MVQQNLFLYRLNNLILSTNYIGKSKFRVENILYIMEIINNNHLLIDGNYCCDESSIFRGTF